MDPGSSFSQLRTLTLTREGSGMRVLRVGLRGGADCYRIDLRTSPAPQADHQSILIIIMNTREIDTAIELGLGLGAVRLSYGMAGGRGVG